MMLSLFSPAAKAERAEAAPRLCALLPWSALVAPDVVVQKDGILQTTFVVRGPDRDADSPHELAYRAGRINGALSGLGSGWALFHEARRERCQHYLHAEWQDPAGWLVDVERAQHFATHPHYVSTHHLTFAWLPDSVGGGPKALDASIREFRRRVAATIDRLGPELEQVRKCEGSELLSYLHSTISTRPRRVAVPDVPNLIDAYLPDQPLRIRPAPKLGDSYFRTWTIVGFPDTDHPRRLDALHFGEFSYRWMTRFIAMDRLKAEGLLSYYERLWKQKALLPGGTGSASDKEAASKEARRDIESARLTYGYCTSSVVLLDRSRAGLEHKNAALRKVLHECGYGAVSSTANAREAWLGSLPGNVFANVRRPVVSTANLANMLPLSSIWQGQRDNSHLRSQTRSPERPDGVGLPHVQCSTTGATPYYLNLNPDDVGHALVIGPTGSGKSTLLAILALQWRKYPGARVAFFDMHLSARAATLAMGGRIFEPGKDGAAAFQPLAELSTDDDRAWAADFVELLFDVQKVPVSPSVREHIMGAVDMLRERPVQERTLTELCRLMRSFDPGHEQVLSPYCEGGKLGSIFDGSRAVHEPADWTVFEMSHLMSKGQAATVPGMLCIFRLLERMFDGRPMLMPLDEVWRLAADTRFLAKLVEYLRTLRKKNVFILFASQQVEDAARSPAGSTIADSCMTQIFLADPNALRPDRAESYAAFGLSRPEIATLAELTRKRDYCLRTTEGGTARFRPFSLSLGPVQLALAGMSSELDQQFLDRMVQEHPPGEHLKAILQRRGVDWAVDALREQSAATQPVRRG